MLNGCRTGLARRYAMLVLLCGSLSAVQAADKPVLRFIVGSDWAPPYIELREERPVGGLAFQLMEAIARAADAQPSYLVLPPKRTKAALLAGEGDLMCLLNPEWLAEFVSPERIGPEMVLIEDVLAVTAAAGDAQPLDLQAQRGLRVGTVRGYRYPKLEPLFHDGRLMRDDAATQQGVIEKLVRGRTIVAIVDRLVLAQHNRRHPADQSLRVMQVVTQTKTHCLLGGKTRLPADQLQRALRAVVDRGELGRLMQRYR